MSAGLSTQQMEYAARRLGQSSSILFLLRRAPYECDGDFSCMVIVTPPQLFPPASKKRNAALQMQAILQFQ